MEREEESRECNKGLEYSVSVNVLRKQHYRSASNFRGVLAKFLEKRVIKYFWHLKQDRPEGEKSEQSNVGNISRGSVSSFCFITLILDLF